MKLPKWGPNMIDGLLTRWLKKVGDRVEKGEALCEVETEKVSNQVEAPESGTLVEILVNEEEEVEVGAVLARIEVD